MIVYVETSALIKLLIEEKCSDVAAAVWDSADARLTSRLSYPEGRAALAAAARAGRITGATHARAKERLAARIDELMIVEVDAVVATLAGDLAEGFRLRGYGALHLASVLAVSEDEVVMVSWDRDLLQAATAAGVDVATG